MENKTDYKWNLDMDFEEFCDINAFPTYSEDASDKFNELTFDYIKKEYEK